MEQIWLDLDNQQTLEVCFCFSYAECPEKQRFCFCIFPTFSWPNVAKILEIWTKESHSFSRPGSEHKKLLENDGSDLVSISLTSVKIAQQERALIELLSDLFVSNRLHVKYFQGHAWANENIFKVSVDREESESPRKNLKFSLCMKSRDRGQEEALATKTPNSAINIEQHDSYDWVEHSATKLPGDAINNEHHNTRDSCSRVKRLVTEPPDDSIQVKHLVTCDSRSTVEHLATAVPSTLSTCMTHTTVRQSRASSNRKACHCVPQGNCQTNSACFYKRKQKGDKG